LRLLPPQPWAWAKALLLTTTASQFKYPKGIITLSYEISATYCPEDNKLRLSSFSRLDSETYKRVTAAGFKWAPKQGFFVAPMWTPSREDLCLELAGEIGDEDSTLAERAEARAERFEDRSQRRSQDADRAQKAVHAIADGIPFGQPILVGHHSERHARKDAKRIENGMQKTVEMWRSSEYWRRRAKSALLLAEHKGKADVRARRIKSLEADKRREDRSKQESEMWLKLWTECRNEPDKDLQAGVARRLAGFTHILMPRKQGDREDYDHSPSIYNAIAGDCPTLYAPRTLDEVFTAVFDALPRQIEQAARWIEHIANRLIYERAMLEDQGGTEADKTGPEKGGAVVCWTFKGWSYIQKVNKVSVTILFCFEGSTPFKQTIPFDKLKAVMSKAEVDAARAEGRLIESQNKVGFALLDPAPAPEPEATRAAPEIEDNICPDGPQCKDPECRAERTKRGIFPPSDMALQPIED
jgi:hypothetical protein